MINIDNRTYTPLNSKRNITYTGALDTTATAALRMLDTNPMMNAVGIDLFSMVIPRTAIEAKERNKYSAAETFFREFTGTIIVCLSASFFARGIAKIANKLIKPNIKINTNSWFSNASLDFLEDVYGNSKNTTQYVENVLNKLSGKDGKKTVKFADIKWNNIEWADEERWSKINWDNKNFKNIHQKLKSKSSIISLISKLINDKTISERDTKHLKQILEFRLTNALKTDKVHAGDFSTSMGAILRDTVDLGYNVFTNTSVNNTEAISKIRQINKIKSLGAISLSSALGLSNQYINRKITEKRTGTKGFVGDADYSENITNKKSTKNTSKLFLLKKIIASVGMAALTIAVMKVKSPKDFLKKIELTGPVTSGNAIKTVYAATLIGRFMASDNERELKETTFRDYFGFLNWLVFGGFAAKGVANLLDKKKKNLFNISKDGKGLRHWLNDISLKSHNEIAAKGKSFASKNMWKLNLAHASGLAYSMTALGIVLPMINVLTVKPNNNKQNTDRMS